VDSIQNILFGFVTAFQPINLVYCFIGVFLGTLVGVLPGIGSLATISLLFPITYYLDPTTAIIMLAGVYYGGDYGGSIASILLRLPGSASSAVTTFDGYPMAQQGRAGVALLMTTVGSFIGGSIGILVLMAFAPSLAQLTLSFGSPEYFALMVLGLVACGSITADNPIKGVSMVLLGLLLGSIGTDLISGVSRYNFGFYELFDGIEIAVVAMALFGVSEIISSVGEKAAPMLKDKITYRSMIPTRDDWRRSFVPILRGTGIGGFIGVLPGVGGSIASFLSYAVEKKSSKTPERFGKGAIEGVVAPESANNAAAQTAFIPTLTMGIPGTASMALLLGAMMIHGIQPGPGLMKEHPTVFWGLIASFWAGNIMLVILNIPLIGIWIKLLQIPYRFLFPGIMALMCVGVLSINGSTFDIWLLLVVGAVGYFMRVLGFHPASLLIGFVLGPMMEENFRRSMVLARGDFLYFFQRPITFTLFALTLALIAWSIFSAFRNRGKAIPLAEEV